MAQTLEHNNFVTQVTPVEIPLCGVDVEVIQKLDDEPNDVGGLSAQELKERFDHVGAELKSYLNERLIPTVVSNDLTEQVRQEAETERVKNERERVEKEAERETAETARLAGETARVGAESQRETAETARVTAEEARAAAETARLAGETARAGAENERETAENGRESAEVARAAAETARARAESQRETAETGRATAEAARVDAETARVTAETARAAAETARAGAESQRETAETGRATAETARVTAEEVRAAAETVRLAAETTRAGAENERETAETGRETAEEARAAAEAARVAAETARAGAEDARVQAEAQRVDTDNGIVAQATAQATQAAGSAQSAGESAGAAAGSAQAAQSSQTAAAASAEEAAESAEAAAAAKTAAENAKTGAETAQTAAQTAKTSAEEQAQTATAAATQSTAEANRAKLEADRAQAIAGGDFITPVELAQAVAVKANIPLIGSAELAETLPAGGVLLVAEGGSGEEAKARQIAVKDKDGVLQVVELGGSGEKRVNRGDLLQEIQIANISKYVRRRETTLTWAEVEALTPNTQVAPTEAEKEMYKAEDGTYTLERIVYDGYISQSQAVGNVGLIIKAIAADETSKVTAYNGTWGKNTNVGASQIAHVMNASSMVWFGALRGGMDDMKVAANSTPIDYDAQQRVYFDVETLDGSVVDHYVLVIHLAPQYNHNVGQYQFDNGFPIIGSNGKRLRGYRYLDKVKAQGTAPTAGGYAIWAHPGEIDPGICPPDATVTLWSDDAAALITAGTTDGLTNDQISTVNTYGATDKWGHHYPLAFRVRVPWCDLLHIKILAEDPLSEVGIEWDDVQSPTRPKIYSWTQGGISRYFDLNSVGRTPGKTLQLYAGVRSTEKCMSNPSENACKGFTITVEFEAPRMAELMLGSTVRITFPAGAGERAYTISDGTDIKSGSTDAGELFTVLRNCNATYQATVTMGGKTYTGQIVTGPYFGQYTLSQWTEVAEE